MEAFYYDNQTLYCEGVKLADIAGQFDTPAYVYSQAQIAQNFDMLDRAFGDIPHLICFSLKANSNLSIGRIAAGLGAGADIVSGGELFKALKMGIDPQRIVYASVGKLPAEIEYALKAHILMFNVESRAELETINHVAGNVGLRAPIALRINPNIDPKTHPYITTGMTKYKFGIPVEEALQLYSYVQDLPNVEAKGIQMHIGSQLVAVHPIVEAATKVVELTLQLKRDGIDLQYVNIGGGLGIRYEDENPEGPETLAEHIVPLVRETGCTLVMEPGRFIVGNAGALLTRVIYTKRNPAKKFVIVDAAMNDLIRPSLYDAYHPILSVAEVNELEKVDVVGPICESGDFFAHDRELAKFEAGDLMLIQCAGAYGFSMSSNYNSRLRAAEVLVSGDACRLVRRREGYEDLVRGEEL
ncbi:MAG: diaminopimelate decarboxylase [Chloroflexi bacterium]|nr:diaminopimelate decarboxylase [Chloroflexota bacterium]MDA8188924.1 diaminopimelate decarboxylase [Dehalococcoidales bacterium]